MSGRSNGRHVECGDYKRMQIAGHRWKYAIPTTPLDKRCLFNDTLNVGLCGDWCLGNRVEAAWQSGAAANHLLTRAGKTTG